MGCFQNPIIANWKKLLYCENKYVSYNKMPKKNTLENQKTNFLQKCFCRANFAYIITIIGIIIVIMCGIFLYKRLDTVKEQLESCRSSCRSV